jgi:hypothetical protein
MIAASPANQHVAPGPALGHVVAVARDDDVGAASGANEGVAGARSLVLGVEVNHGRRSGAARRCRKYTSHDRGLAQLGS